MIGTIARVIRAEGLTSAIRRASERVAEASRTAALRARGRIVKSEPIPILNVSAGAVASRLGGVPVQLFERLRAERTLRDVALLHSGVLELSAPTLHAFTIGGDFETSVRKALAITGAGAIHLEGTYGVPVAIMLRLMESGIRAIVSIHDFSLFCARPHLLELPMERFCCYSHDLDRCLRCLRQTWDVATDDQAERRALGRQLLTSATGLVFPSQFLLDIHREHFSLPRLAGEVIEPGVPMPDLPPRKLGTRSAIAYVGSVKPHKGAKLMPEVVRLAGDIKLQVFGGGDEDLLRVLRRVPGVNIHGYFRHRQLPSLLARNNVGLVVLPSISPETYGLVLSEAWLAGAAVVAFDHGAIAERIRRDGGGWLAPPGSGAAGLAEIIRRWTSGEIACEIPRVIPSPADAARAYVERYRQWGLYENTVMTKG